MSKPDKNQQFQFSKLNIKGLDSIDEGFELTEKNINGVTLKGVETEDCFYILKKDFDELLNQNFGPCSSIIINEQP